MADPIYAVDITAYDPTTSTTLTLRYATRGFQTGAADTPAHTLYDERIKQPALLRRDLFGAGTTQGRSRVGYGDLLLANDDGVLDGLAGYAFDGRALTIRRGVKGAAYPSAWTTMLVATMAGVNVDAAAVRVRLRDRQEELDLPLQTTKYLGDNALPAGLEGVDDLKGKPKPVCYGAVKNVAPPQVNTSKLIYQVADGAIQSLDAVYDQGLSLGISPFAWTQVATAFGLATVYGLAYGAGLWVAVGESGKVYTSPDRVTWTSRTSTFGANDVRGIFYNSSNLFVIVGFAGNLATSPDGITWTSRTSSFGADNIWGVTYGNGLWVATGSTQKVATSPDGITWTQRTSGFSAAIVQCAAYGALVYVIGGAGGQLASSTDGITWTLRTVPFTVGQAVQAIVWGNDRFVAVGSAGVIAVSVNGVDWIQRYLGGSAVALSAAVFAFGYYVLGGQGPPNLFVSQDAVSWVPVNPASIGNVYSLAADGSTILAGDGSGASVWSPVTGGGTYANTTELQNDSLAPAAGTYKVYLAGGYFRLGSTPAGLITADVTQGAAASNRTAGQLFTAVLTRAGKTSADWSAADITALDAANASVLGYWTHDETTFAAVIDQVAGSVGAWWGVDRLGVFRVKQFTAPSGTPVLKLTDADLHRPLARVATQDEGGGLPVRTVTVRWGRYWTVQDQDVAGGVSDARRVQLAKAWREVVSAAAAPDPRTIWLLSPDVVEETLLTIQADAQAEATRRQVLRGVARDRWEVVLSLDDETVLVDLGDVVRLTHLRFALTAGKDFRVMTVEPNAAARTLLLHLWG